MLHSIRSFLVKMLQERDPTPKHHNLPKQLISAACLMIAAVWSIAYFAYNTEVRNNELSLSAQATNLLLELEKETAATIRSFDHFLVAARRLRATDPLSLKQMATLNIDIDKGEALFGITNANGDIVFSSINTPEKDKINLSDRPSFLFHSANDTDELYIGPPIVGPILKRDVIRLSRRLANADGSFGGIIFVSVPIASFTDLYGNSAFGVGGGIAIVGDDGIFRAGTGSFASRIGQHYREPQSVQTIPVDLFFFKDTKNVVEKQVFDGQLRLVASHNLVGYPLTVMLAMTSDFSAKVLEPARLIYIWVAVTASSIILVGALWIRRAAVDASKSIEARKSMEVEKTLAESHAADRSMFLAVMSHEIRTPLNGVLGALDLMRSSILDDRCQRCVEMATENGEALLHLIDDILLVSKAENSAVEIVQVAFCLEELSVSVHKSMVSLALQNRNRLKLDLCKEASTIILGDPRRLRQVLVNLIGNANKFTKRGDVVLSITCLNKGAKKLCFRISVKDRGIGIPEDKIPIIFDRFQSLDSTYTRRTDGTGLGLAICDKIVSAMGGQIIVESKVGHGSNFYFDLYFELSASPVYAKNDMFFSEPALGEHTRLRVLLTEDNPTNTYVATQFLTDAGHSVRHASNGHIAVKLSASEPFDVILMDISMPGMNGMEATAAIRASNSINKKTPIIALTAHAVEGDEAKFRTAGMDGYLTKPVRKEILLKTLQYGIGETEPYRKEDSQPFDSLIAISTLNVFVRDRTPERALAVVEIFVEELKTKAEELQTIISGRNQTALGDLAHSNIGSGALLGASKLVELSRTIESDCAKNSAFDPKSATQLHRIMCDTIEAFNAYKSQTALTQLALHEPAAA